MVNLPTEKKPTFAEGESAFEWRSRLRQCLAKSGKTRSQVCQEAGLNPAYLTQILEHKSATPRIDNLARVAEVLGTSVSFLVDGLTMDDETRRFAELYGSLNAERKAAVLVILEDMAKASRFDA